MLCFLRFIEVADEELGALMDDCSDVDIFVEKFV